MNLKFEKKKEKEKRNEDKAHAICKKQVSFGLAEVSGYLLASQLSQAQLQEFHFPEMDPTHHCKGETINL